jgi:hypothetical protein
MCSILLGLIVDLPVSGGQGAPHVVKVVCTLLDFLFLAQFQSHTSETLTQLEDCLVEFHNNKAVFVNLGIQKDFNIPKLHSLLHYGLSICLFGTTDNYNTKQSECLHIDLAKEAYCATNKKDEYAQMTTWLEHHKKLQQHTATIDWRQNNLQNFQTQTLIGPLRPHAQSIKMTEHPSKKAVSFLDVSQKYGLALFQDALGDFIASVNNPRVRVCALCTHSANTLLLFCTVRIYHKIKFMTRLEIVDAVHVRLEWLKCGQITPARFDTVLIQGSRQGM